MSKGPGRVELIIEAVFREEPRHQFSIYELARVAFPNAAIIEKKHLVSAGRAAWKVAERMGWQKVYGGRWAKIRPRDSTE